MTSNTCLNRRRGSVYVFVLSTALLVTCIGLSSLLAVRVERRTAAVTQAAVQARFGAASFLEVVVLRIAQNPTWRSSYTHNVWTSDETVDGITYTFKFVDEQDGDLSDDAYQPARLYAKASVGEAVRIYSVLLATEGSGGSIAERRVAAGTDDAEERSSNGYTVRNSPDLELAFDDYYYMDTVGMRFTDVGIAPGAAIANAYIQFRVDETDYGSVSLTIRGEDVDDASSFTTSSYDISSRPTTTASVSWSPPYWNVVGEVGPNQRTPNIATVIQEIVDRAGWTSGSNLVIIITGTGTRTAESYDGYASQAPLLRIEPAVLMLPVAGTWRREVLP
jgi:hypothetical protein